MVEVYALVGPSGTGKSASALSFAHSKQIPAIIDDGLLVYKGKKEAGISGKYEKNYVTAIKRAIFYDEDHRVDVQSTISKLDANSILLLGTSYKMVDKIAKELELGPISRYYSIEEVRSSSEIKLALYMRKTAGKHIIPVPYLQLEPRLFERLLQRGKKILSRQNEIIGETTIIRPRFHHGTINISSSVIKCLIQQSCKSVHKVKRCNKIWFSLEDYPTIQVNLTVKIDQASDINLFQLMEEVQEKVYMDMLMYLEIEFNKIDIVVDGLEFACN